MKKMMLQALIAFALVAAVTPAFSGRAMAALDDCRGGHCGGGK